jgi:hypothetical protein
MIDELFVDWLTQSVVFNSTRDRLPFKIELMVWISCLTPIFSFFHCFFYQSWVIAWNYHEFMAISIKIGLWHLMGLGLIGQVCLDPHKRIYLICLGESTISSCLIESFIEFQLLNLKIWFWEDKIVKWLRAKLFQSCEYFSLLCETLFILELDNSWIL